ncbi:hypothetical protein [Paenibacillus radicis (ex Gao et al. 2016)]|uniref:Uncharacterized protein n=1 Tax=Paenibacillus radicis (ex Gao et al. 2016) TaxID=1737354 RepID=A0A917GT94_9BACL|nr:hypothetical protein [Paenibacillus radicis (ex Gao et al. 2016)]GGG56417.1 hypothetical protein GCM10010918_06730 [Paenibacillus radicis (ex Gao et al. 2016)]
MTLFYYIASAYELPTGSFGQNKTVMTLMDYVTHVNPAAKEEHFTKLMLERNPHKHMEVYETEEDAAGLYITGPMTGQNYSHLFQHPYVYQVNAEMGDFKINDEMKQTHSLYYQTSKKCLTELFDYLRANVRSGEYVELFSCWTDGLDRFKDSAKKEPDLVLELSTFQLGSEFEWKERQYIKVVR